MTSRRLMAGPQGSEESAPYQLKVALWKGPTAEANNVRFGSLADILRCGSDVCFTPESGHEEARAECPLSASSGHPQTERPPDGALPKSISSE